MGVERRVGGPPLFAGPESARTWAAGVAERANQAPGMHSVGVRTGGQVEEGDEGGGDENLNGKFARLRVGVDVERVRAHPRPRADKKHGRRGTDGRAPAELSSAIGDAASLFAFIFHIASTGAAERHEMTY